MTEELTDKLKKIMTEELTDKLKISALFNATDCLKHADGKITYECPHWDWDNMWFKKSGKGKFCIHEKMSVKK